MTLYHDLILDHAKHPRNQGSLSPCTHRAEAKNPTCGDHLSMSLTTEDGVVTDIRFEGAGCAISQASASLLTEYAKGKTEKELLSMEPKDILALLGIELSPNRLKCALLSLETLKKALK